MWKCAPVPVRFENGFGMKVRDRAVRTRHLAGRHLEVDEIVGGLQRVGVGEVDFELAVRVLVIDLIDVDADCAQVSREIVEKRASARESLVVVAGLVELVGLIERLQRAAGVASSAA